MRRLVFRSFQIPDPIAVAMLLAVLVLAGCTTATRIPFTAAEQAMATPIGFTDVRFSGSDTAGAVRLQDYARQLQAERKRPLEVLSLSGGGANGAYGAGVIYGWTQHGNRPAFDVVTGVSTGALAAPFAFLGASYDEKLRSAYTGGHSAQLLDFEGLFALFRPSLFSPRPLVRLVDTFIDDALIQAVAVEHQTGRRLLIATANLDTQTLTLWNMGAIAAGGGPQATRLFKDVLIASASVPGIFPPVMIGVDAAGRRFTEMHVDGSTISSFFAVPEAMLLWTEDKNARLDVNLYVLINGKLDNEFTVTPRATVDILERSLDTASKANTRTELTALAAFGLRNGISLRIGYVPTGGRASPLDFNQQRMTLLFEQGRQQSAAGSAWMPFGEDGEAP